jgi:two-component system sensor histidine kinase HydH
MQQNARNRQMAAIGELASHVSHEIRNPLSSIKLNLQSIDRELRSGAVPIDLHDVVQLCLREVNRLDGTVQGVLRLAGSHEPQLTHLAVHAVLRDALQTMQPQLEERGIALDLQLDALRDDVRADATQLRGVFVNLLVNGRDAMPDGGTLRVWTELAEESARGRTIRVHVADDGPGVRPEDRDRIFQPFFTTKATGSGIGLPLAVRTIEKHGGRLWLERRSELERGAEFVIELPLAADTGTDSSRNGAARALTRAAARWSRARSAAADAREGTG